MQSAAATTSTRLSGASSPSAGARVRTGAIALAQVVALSALWLLADWLRSRLGLPLPAGLLGLLVLAALLFSGAVRGGWVRRGADWLLGEMLLFFIPAVLAVVQYPDLVRHQGWRICAVIALSTLAVMLVTALVVEQVYRLELRLARRGRGRKSKSTAGAATINDRQHHHA
ncbi:CidA/LrgA family protein [Cupriavidus basilensis]|uniref:CidA/LrgA family protein n=1 Tax=Cupriavidus basilensis TaxID=68895 RepID=A0ABT6AXC9_9BURK|nr:CidA/LrgA family protein [Cupriavidus basilensis]MDF3837262.1 CidA/LrgA family protein [Cupriavidus basilensis]